MTAGTSAFSTFFEKLRQSWSIETGTPWRTDNPACGQCGVTALVAHDEFGGEILKTDVNGAWHFYNFIDGCRIDFTVSQFQTPIAYADIQSNRDEALSDTSLEQYNLLGTRVSNAPSKT